MSQVGGVRLGGNETKSTANVWNLKEMTILDLYTTQDDMTIWTLLGSGILN